MWEDKKKYPPDVEAHLAFLREMKAAEFSQSAPQTTKPKRGRISRTQLIIELVLASIVLLLFL